MEPAQRDSLLRELASIVGPDAVEGDAPMARYTTLRLGGPADILVQLPAPDKAPQVLALAKARGVPVTLMGNGSNLLVRDGGIRGLVLRVAGFMGAVAPPQPLKDGRALLAAQAGASLARLAQAAADHSLEGLAFGAGIPGTVGGAVFMNAGAYGGEMKDVVTRVSGYTLEGQPFALTGEEMAFGYRRSRLSAGDPALVTLVECTLRPGDGQAIRAHMRQLADQRRQKQPITLPSCGSTFQRPQGHFAAALIEACGLKGYRVGGASVSQLHAGFLVNDQQATAGEYLQLMEVVQRTVQEKTGVALQPEVRILGEDAPPAP